MKFNLGLILLITTAFVSAVTINKGKVENPYTICNKKDYNCIKGQLKTCHKDYINCLKSNKPKIFQAIFGNCSIIGKQCNEILKEAFKPSNQNSFEPTAKNVRIIGRTKYQDGYLWIGLTGAGIEYKFNGKVTTINVTADTTSYSEDKPAHIIIYADDEIYLDTVMTEKNMDFTVLFDKSGKHVIRFIKTSEALFGSIRINEIKADAKKISPTKPEKLRIEFIGDSITCGYGVDGTGTDVFTTRTEDGTKSYAIKTAKKFHAEYSIVAYSAFCLVPFLPFDGKIMNSLPGIYDRLGYSEHPNEFDDGVYELQNEVWDQQQYIPDLVVINLGTNDNYFGQAYAPDMSVIKSDYVNLYEKFLSQIRSLYPQTKILCTLGMMGQELYPEIEEAVNNYTTKTGDSNVKAFKLSVQNSEKNGFGTDNHPNAQSHVDATYELVGAIEKFFGWKSDKDVNIELTE